MAQPGSLSNYFWSWIWASPLQKNLARAQMHNLKEVEDSTPILRCNSERFGAVKKLTDKNKTAYVGRKLSEDALSDAGTRKATLEKFPRIAERLYSLRHSNILQMKGFFFSDSLSYLPTLVYEGVIGWVPLDRFLLKNRSEVDKVTILENVASGLEYLHDQEPPVLHLNLTAANVMIFEESSGNPLRSKIADAGIVSLVNAGRSTLVQPLIVDYLPYEEKTLEWNAKVDVLCFGLLMGHVILQQPITTTLPIFWGDIVSDDAGVCQLHEHLQVHPLFSLVLQCLNKSQQPRPTAFAIKEQIQCHKDTVIQWSTQIQTELSNWIKSSDTLDIMITGKTGSGKTSLINGLIGAEAGNEGDKLDRGTTKVMPKELVLEEKKVRIWDTPGLQDGTGEEEQYLDQMKRFCSDCDLYIYCVNMSQKRFEASEKRAIEALTKTFGRKFWPKVLFVLTFANTEVGNFPMDCNKEERFQNLIKKWHSEIAKELVKLGVEQKVAEAIEMVPTGYRKPLQHYPTFWELPGIPNWFEKFWYKCAEVMDERGLPALIAVNYKRLKAPENITEEDLKNSSIEEQPIPIRGRIAAATGLALAGTGVAAGAGAGIGAALGGIIFALAGPAGIAGGAALGSALGTAVIDPIVVSMYWKYSASKKSKK